MSNKKHTTILCIRCPKGCEMTVLSHDDTFVVQGNECRIGEDYALEEIRNPMRIVSTTIGIYHALYPRLPIRTREPIPKNKIDAVMQAVKNVRVAAPVTKEQVVIKNVADTGVDMIAERTMDMVEP